MSKKKSTMGYVLAAIEKITEWNNAQKKRLNRHDEALKEIRDRLWVLENPPGKEKQ